MKILDKNLMQNLSAQAKQNPRLRQNYNLHDSYDDASQRLLNAMEPGSYIRPHRHLAAPKPEGFVAVRGRLALFTFNEQGQIEKIVRFGPEEPAVGVDLPSGIWHTVVSLEAGSIFYETKPGPYTPMDQEDMAPWAPEEGSSLVQEYLKSLVRMVAAQGDDAGLLQENCKMNLLGI